LALACGLSPSTISRLENAREQPYQLTRERLAEVLAWPLADLFPIYDNGRAANAAEVTTTAGTGRDDQP
jgi:transcriptional regulator with XRE-family HTH domain